MGRGSSGASSGASRLSTEEVLENLQKATRSRKAAEVAAMEARSL